MRKYVIAGNWKMNKTPSEAKALIQELKPLVADAKCDVVVIPPFTSLCAVLEETKGTNIKVGAQNMHFEESGAYTGEIAPSMLKELGVSHVVIGHSERREYFAETDFTVNKKVKKALEHGLTPILCCGESLEQRELGITFEHVATQIKIGFTDISAEDAKKIIVAYEPIWAIGTGKTATDEQANEVCKAIRDTLAALYGQATADEITIQYGGSVNAKNASGLMAMSDIDGGLVGGASLKAPDFSTIVHF